MTSLAEQLGYGQVAELAWDGWRTELRDAHGRWTRGGAPGPVHVMAARDAAFGLQMRGAKNPPDAEELLRLYPPKVGESPADYRERLAVALAPPPPRASPPGVVTVPGVKQYMFPGMGEPVTEFGHASAPVQQLSKLEPAANELLDTGDVDWPEQGIQGSVAVVTLGDGTKVVTKSQDPDRNDREELAYYVAQVLGLNAPPIARSKSNPRDIIEGYVPGQTLIRYAQEQEQPGSDGGEGYDAEQIEQEIEFSASDIGFFDYLTGNADRHDANVLVDENGTPVPIDHGMTFHDEWGTTDSPFWTGDESDPGGGTTNDVAATKADLAKIEPEFARLGHLDWYQEMLDRVDMLQAA